MKKFGIIAAVFAALAFPAVSQAASTPVTSLSGNWAATNSSLRLTPDGVNFGIYPDANSGGSLYYSGMNNKTLADITRLAYTFRYTARNEPENYSAAPYLRIFLNGDTQDVIFDPSACATASVPMNERLSVEVTDNEVRYSDDGCTDSSSRQNWADVVAAHGTDVISGIYITQGYAVGQAFSADVFRLNVNEDFFVFGAPQAGPTGPAGPTGTTGTTGTTTTITRVVTEPAKPIITKGATLRTLSVPVRKGQKITKVRATLKTAKGDLKLKTSGRLVYVDLTGKTPANYNVTITVTYRKADGTTRKVRISRNLSVTLVQ